MLLNPAEPNANCNFVEAIHTVATLRTTRLAPHSLGPLTFAVVRFYPLDAGGLEHLRVGQIDASVGHLWPKLGVLEGVNALEAHVRS